MVKLELRHHFVHPHRDGKLMVLDISGADIGDGERKCGPSLQCPGRIDWFIHHDQVAHLNRRLGDKTGTVEVGAGMEASE